MFLISAVPGQIMFGLYLLLPEMAATNWKYFRLRSFKFCHRYAQNDVALAASKPEPCAKLINILVLCL